MEHSLKIYQKRTLRFKILALFENLDRKKNLNFTRKMRLLSDFFQILCKKDFYCKIDPKLIHKSRKQIYDLPCWKYSEKNTSAHSFLIQFFWVPSHIFMPSVIFFQVAATCYTKLNLCLLAIEQRKYEGGDIFINPKNKVINPNAIGKAFGPYIP